MALSDYTYGRKSGNLPVEDTFLRAISGLPNKPAAPPTVGISADRGQAVPEPPLLTVTPEVRGMATDLRQSAFTPSSAMQAVPTEAPQQSRGFLGNVLHGLSSGISTFGEYVSSPGGRQALAQLAGAIAPGNRITAGLASFASQMAKNDQYEQIKQLTLKGLPLGPAETAGLDPQEVEQVRLQALNEQQAKLDRQEKRLREQSLMLTEAQKRAQSVAETGLAAAQTQKLLQEPTPAEKQRMELEQRAISAGVQTFPVGMDQEKSFVYDPSAPGGIRYLGTGTKTKQADAGSAVAQERLDLDQYKQALAEVAKDPEIAAIGDLSIDPATGSPTIVLKNPGKDAPLLRRKTLEILTQKTARGLIKNPAYLQAAQMDIPYEFQGATFTGMKNEKGQPMYRKVDPTTGKSLIGPLEL